jgi:uncharacterized protein
VIVDVHTHTPTHRSPVADGEQSWNTAYRPDKTVKLFVSWQEYEEAFAEAGVDISLVFNIARPAKSSPEGDQPSWRSLNDRTAEFADADPAHRIGFMSVLPDDPTAIEEIERCTSDLGLKGIKLAPNYQRFDPLSPNAYAVYRIAEQRGLPIVFHQGTSAVTEAPLRYAHPLAMDEIAMRHPELRIVMAHMGHPWQADTIAVVRKHPHVYADISALFYRPWSFYCGMRLATEWSVLDKLLFGSDFPIIAPEETLSGLRNVNAPTAGTALPVVPLDAIERIIHRNSLELLGLAPSERTGYSTEGSE